jgi:hypothetical protein
MIERTHPLLVPLEFAENIDFAVRSMDDYVQLVNILGSVTVEMTKNHPEYWPIYVTYVVPT